MSTPIHPITHPHLTFQVLNQQEIERIHTATLEVIAHTGVRFPLPQALDILEAHGASVDRTTQVAKIPGQAIEDALKLAPPVYNLAARDPSQDLSLDGKHVYLGTDGCGVEVLDPFTGELRRATKSDVAFSVRTMDALEDIAFWWSMVSAQDRPESSRSLHELDAAWNNTTKHLQTESLVHASEMRTAIEMASIIAGGKGALRQRPLLSIMQCTISPLAHESGSLEAGLIAAEAGLPVGYMTMASCASTGPVTMAGNLVVGNAEVISALALIQMASPGAPVYYAAAQTAMDLRTGAYTGGGPEDFLFGAASNQLADFYHVPLSMGTFATGAKEPDWQAAVDDSFSAFMACASGADMLLGVGLLHGSRILSYEEMLMDCEIYSIVRKMLEGVPVNDEALALDVIDSVGPGGNFLAQKHTRQHMRELWLPHLMDRRPYEQWMEKRDGAREWARQRAQDILKNHEPDPLEPKLAEELKRIIQAHEKAN
ncbi:MAG TPA: trimethylamine methyltransferase family protein [Longilinea sp.]|nr:trimethylamine methyltransferase family protein [Longilinea sp.]